MQEQDRIIKINIEEEMKSSYIDYSMSVIVARARADLTRHMGARQECLYVDDFPEMWTSESQTLSRVFSALHSHPRLSAGNTSKCMYVIIWHFSMVKHDYQSL